MSTNFAGYVTTLCDMLVATTTDVNFTNVLQAGMDDAELRCYRDLDLLNTVVRDQTVSFTPGNRMINLPGTLGTFVVVEQINVITPASATTAEVGTRNPLTPTTRESLDYTWPSVNGSTVPQYFAMFTNNTIVVAPWPDQNYTLEVVGTIRPQTLYTTNYLATNTSVLSTYFPDLFLASSMVWFTGWQRDYGQQTTDPSAGVTWEQHYQTLLKGAVVEENRKKFRAEGWSSKSPSPIATPPRT